LILAIRLVCEIFRPVAEEKALELKLDFGQLIPEQVTGDLEMFFRLLILVLDNAITHTLKGSISVTCFYQREHLLLNFSDTSSGVSSAEKEVLSAPDSAFEFLNPPRQSLALAGVVVKILGGSMSVKGEERLGCIVTMNIPFPSSQTPRPQKISHDILMARLVEKLTENTRFSQVIYRGISYMIDETTALKTAVLRNKLEDCHHILHSMKGFPAGFELPELTGLIKIIEKHLQSENKDKDVVLTRIDELHNFLSALLVQIPAKTSTEDLSLEKPRQNRKNNLNILVAEDNKMNQEMLAYILEELNFNFTMVENGVEVLNALQLNTYDLLLLDMQMPIMDGIETVKKIRLTPKWRDLPIISVTAQNMKGDEKKYRQAGCDAFVAKPIDINELTRKIELLLGR